MKIIDTKRIATSLVIYIDFTLKLVLYTNIQLWKIFMSPIHLLTSDTRPTNTQWHWKNLTWWNNSNTQTSWAPSNALAIAGLCENGWLAFVPYYNVLGKSVRDTMQAIAENHALLKLHKITRMRIEYVLAMRKWVPTSDITDVYSHPQAILQTKDEREKIIPRANEQHTKSTAAWLDTILDPLNSNKNFSAITTPFQIHSHEINLLDRIDNFGPANNYTYFALLWLKGSDVTIPILWGFPDHTLMEESIKFWVITIADYPWSLCDALKRITEQSINIMSIMSFLQPDGKVIFTIAYQEEEQNVWIYPTNNKKPTIHDLKSQDNQQFSATIHIPTNVHGSLYNTLHLLRNTINLQEITSIGTGMDTVDFEITFSLISGSSSENLENNINTILHGYPDEDRRVILPSDIGLKWILHNLR